ncbi:hypothetical protein [Streptomyces sp. AC550_RSS872]|uniref:hypothetical protein n=1 Tax=Streptomyces sp. AC550_RSS872 TaxID=2823689 RepID=UPI0020B754A1|nr:hypothetical protein [Streptomyces sp. AC550_RSS872]
MNAPRYSPLEGQPLASGGQVAELAPPAPAVGDPKGVAEGVRTALGTDPHGDDGRRPIAWLHISAPGRGVTPTAVSKCLCGRDRRAFGNKRVLALIADHTAHRENCPLRTPQEGRYAA